MSAKETYNDFIQRLAHRIREFCSRGGRLASLYYFVFSKKFDREHLAVLQGKQLYTRTLGFAGDTSPRLRRNIHRLEKGLIMRPRKPVFAEGYIAETVQHYKLAVENASYSQQERKWARDVLDDYFGEVASSPVVDSARALYESIVESAVTGEQGPGFKPYPHKDLPESRVGFAELENLCLRRRSVRWYTGAPVSREDVERAVRVAALAPSACNRQSFRFLVTTDPAQATRVASCVGGTLGFAENIPAIIIVVGNLASYPHERDRHLIYIDASMAVMQLMLALEAQGLSTCPINWPDLQLPEDNLGEIVELPGHERVVMLVAVGVADPDGGIPFSQKKTGSSIMDYLD